MTFNKSTFKETWDCFYSLEQRINMDGKNLLTYFMQGLFILSFPVVILLAVFGSIEFK